MFILGAVFFKNTCLSSKQTVDEGDYFCSQSKPVNYFVRLRKINGAAAKLHRKDNAPGINNGHRKYQPSPDEDFLLGTCEMLPKNPCNVHIKSSRN